MCTTPQLAEYILFTIIEVVVIIVLLNNFARERIIVVAGSIVWMVMVGSALYLFLKSVFLLLRCAFT